jgi:predicted Zn-dependent protease
LPQGEAVQGQARRQFMAQAELASAEAYSEGRLRLAKEQAKRAKVGLVNGSPNWIKADDILTFQVPRTN